MKTRLMAYVSVLIITSGLTGCDDFETYTNLPDIKLSSYSEQETTTATIGMSSNFETCRFGELEYWESSNDGDRKRVSIPSYEGLRTTVGIDGLKPGTRYNYNALATLTLDGKKVSREYSTSGSFTTSAPSLYLSTEAYEITDSQAVVWFEYPSDYFTFTGMEYRKESDSEWQAIEISENNGSGHFNLMNLEPDTRYVYRFEYSIIIDNISYPGYYTSQYYFRTRQTSLPLRITSINVSDYNGAPLHPLTGDGIAVFRYNSNGMITGNPVWAVSDGGTVRLSEDIMIEPGATAELALAWQWDRDSYISDNISYASNLYYNHVKAVYNKDLSLTLYNMMSSVAVNITSDIQGTFSVEMKGYDGFGFNYGAFDMGKGDFIERWNEGTSIGRVLEGETKFEGSGRSNRILYQTIPQEVYSDFVGFNISTPNGTVFVPVPSVTWKPNSLYEYYIHFYSDGSYRIRLGSSIESNLVEIGDTYVYLWQYGGSDDVIIK